MAYIEGSATRLLALFKLHPGLIPFSDVKTVTLRVLNCIEKYVNDKDRKRTKQHVWNSIDPQQMLDRGMIRLDADAIRYGQIRINAITYHYRSSIRA